MTHHSGIRRILTTAVATTVVAAVLGSAALAPSASAAPSPTTGLYGAGDPTYDAVWRQSLAIMGLAANDVAPPAAAIAWLLAQQCANGSFQEYRSDLSVPCAASDPVNFTGPDTNASAVALMALMALDDSRVRVPQGTLNKVVDAAERAETWLLKQQGPDGGWPYYPGAKSDANSTGLALSAVLTQAPSYDVLPYRKAARFLGTVAASCADGGGLAYQSGSAVDGSASAQGLVGLVGPMPVRAPRRLAAGAPCASTAKSKAISYLAKGLAANGTLTSALSAGQPDYANTATAVLGLVAAGQGRATVAKAAEALKTNAATFVNGGGMNPTAAGLLLMVARATGTKPASFGGLNLLTTLNASIRK